MSLDLEFPFPPTLGAPVNKVQWVAPKYMLNSANCEFDLKIGIFFDGTNNNWKRDEPKLSQSNIARLSIAYRENHADGFYQTYIPGAGTIFPEIGELEESSFGSGFAEGCEARILFGLLQVFNCIHRRIHQEQPYFGAAQLKALCRNKSSPNKEDRAALATLNEKSGLCMPGGTDSSSRKTFLKKHSVALANRLAQKKVPVLKECTVDVFGFSRGAAEARVFCTWLSEILSNGKLAGVPITCRFLGIIDTVASAGILAGTMGAATNTTGGHDGWASPENLRIPSFVKNCVHMVAMHELRKNFPLDDIRADGTMPANCQQFAYPGSHSDVGGGYGPGEPGIAVGKTIYEGDALKLSQIPLNHMLDCAVAAGVPLWKVAAIDAKTGYNPFAVAPEVELAYKEFVTTSGTAPRRMFEWMQPYLNWRWQVRETYNNLAHIRASKDGDTRILVTSNRKLIRDANLLISCSNVPLARRFLNAVTGKLAAKLKDPKYEQPSISIAHLDPEAGAVLQTARSSPATPAALAKFFDRFVHDSYAGFSKMLEEPTGYWRYRKGFRGGPQATIASTEPKDQDRLPT